LWILHFYPSDSNGWCPRGLHYGNTETIIMNPLSSIPFGQRFRLYACVIFYCLRVADSLDFERAKCLFPCQHAKIKNCPRDVLTCQYRCMMLFPELSSTRTSAHQASHLNALVTYLIPRLIAGAASLSSNCDKLSPGLSLSLSTPVLRGPVQVYSELSVLLTSHTCILSSTHAFCLPAFLTYPT
jgi:hypothetical protein